MILPDGREILFLNTRRFSPVIYENDLPFAEDFFHMKPGLVTDKFVKSGDYQIDEAWWNKQMERCLYGYTVKNAVNTKETIELPHLGITLKNGNVTITGKHYFYLNFWIIHRKKDDAQRKGILPPRFTDLSFENWWIRDRMKIEQKDNLFTKSRQKGYSEEEACDNAYEFLFHPGSQILILGGEDKYNEYTFGLTYRGIMHLRNTQFFKELESDRNDYISTKHTSSEMFSISVSKNVQAGSGKTPSKVLMEECGIWKKGTVKLVAEYIKPSIEAEGSKTGYITYISTGGEIEDGVDDIEEMFYSPEKFGLLEFKNIYEDQIVSDTMVASFTPAWKFELVDEQGNSKKQESIEKLNKERNAKNVNERYKSITNKPFCPSEMFFVSSGGFFGENRIQLLNERLICIRNNRSEQIEERGVLEWINRAKPFDGVKFIPKLNGWLTVIERPEKDSGGNVYLNLYQGGTDSYDQDEAETSDSKGTTVIRKMFRPGSKLVKADVAMINERPSVEDGGAELFYEHSAMLTMWYDCMNNIEYSNLRIFDWYKVHGFYNLLKDRPELAFANKIQNTRVKNVKGTDKSLKPHILAILREDLDPEFISRMYLTEQIKFFAKFRYVPGQKRFNCDVTMASAEAATAAKEDQFLVVKSRDEVENKWKVKVYANVNGRLVQKYV